MTPFKNFVYKILKTTIPRGILVSLKSSYTLSFVYGQFRSAQKWDCRDGKGNPVPWYTYPCIEYIDNHDLSGLNVLEYGSGNSSWYYLNKGARVTSIENHYGWFEKISKFSPPSHTFIFEADETKYVERPEVAQSDIIAIDGSYRTECANYLVKQFKAGLINPAMIIFDNSDWYPDSIPNLDRAMAWPRVDFCGFVPIGSDTCVTSIYINPNRLIPRISGNVRSLAGHNLNCEFVKH